MLTSSPQMPLSIDLFKDEPTFVSSSEAIKEAEEILLDVADYIYAHTSLKPMSKTIFFLSRCLLLVNSERQAHNADELSKAYELARRDLAESAPSDDFDFDSVLHECNSHLEYILDRLHRVRKLTLGTDSLGLVFNTLLRGKCESGEGLGTFLTPEEVVFPMVDILLSTVDRAVLNKTHSEPRRQMLYGDICGGTGRFVYALTHRLRSSGIKVGSLEKSARMFDQSRMAVGLARLNFVFEGMRPRFSQVSDSLTDHDVTALKGRFLMLATNPPFGAGKYRWHSELAQIFPITLLQHLAMRGSADSADPAELFVFRNLDLLAPGGSLAIVLPDGVIQSERFKTALELYERASETKLHIAALVSLPVTTFALGGTVAKTSFAVFKKNAVGKTFAAVAHHVGFLKKGNQRCEDPEGNDLVRIAEEFVQGRSGKGQFINSWRKWAKLSPLALSHSVNKEQRSGIRLRRLVTLCKEHEKPNTSKKNDFHVSILDVDETGLIDILKAMSNEPVTRGISCKAGDILLSCLNPKIWRVAVIPPIVGKWSCSSEFVVLRPNKPNKGWAIALNLQHAIVIRTVRSLAGGTSSSRQRVPKQKILDIDLPNLTFKPGSLRTHVKARHNYYLMRMREGPAYQRLHDGKTFFEL